MGNQKKSFLGFSAGAGKKATDSKIGVVRKIQTLEKKVNATYRELAKYKKKLGSK